MPFALQTAFVIVAAWRNCRVVAQYLQNLACARA